MASLTKDERYLIALYNKTRQMQANVEEDFYIDRFDLGKELGYTHHIAGQIALGLLQANFVKKGSDNEITITEQGQKLVERLVAHLD